LLPGCLDVDDCDWDSSVEEELEEVEERKDTGEWRRESIEPRRAGPMDDVRALGGGGGGGSYPGC
jgi:hypothetical protein